MGVCPKFSTPMASYILRRLWQMIPTLLGVVLLVFFFSSFLAAIRSKSWPVSTGLARAVLPAIRAQLGLDKSRMGATLDFYSANRHLRLGQELDDQRIHFQHLRHAPAGHADHHAADLGAGSRAWRSSQAWRLRMCVAA